MNRLKFKTLFITVIIFVIVFAVQGVAICQSGLKRAAPSTYYMASVSSLTDPDFHPEGKNYVLQSAMSNVNEHNLQFKEFARTIERTLSLQGFHRVDSLNRANLIIRMAYGIGNPIIHQSTQTYNTSVGYSYYVGWTQVYVPPKSQTVTQTSTTYKRFLVVEAYDAKSKNNEVWKTEIKSEGSNGDLRIVLPYMMAAASYHFDTNTDGIKKFIVYPYSPPYLMLTLPLSVLNGHPFSGHERFGVQVSGTNIGQLIYKYQKAGVLVLAVAENSVAQKMGIHRFDVILAINNKIIKNANMLSDALGQIKPGRNIKVTFFDWDKLDQVTQTGKLE